MTFIELAETVLNEADFPLEVNDIWKVATKKNYIKKLNSNGKTPMATLGSRLYIEVRDNPQGKFAYIGTRPKRFYLKSKFTQAALEQWGEQNNGVETKEDVTHFPEKDLHPFLAYYAHHHLGCYAKTIHHRTSSKKEFGEWVHPDMVGCYYPLEEWMTEVYELSSQTGNVAIRLFSFELKKELNFSNLRESFFQTVSNSSWANESYLVTARIDDSTEFMNEITRLSSSFGIGIIRLDLEDPDASDIILPARVKEVLDWEMINKLAAMNKDFKEFLNRVKIDLISKQIHKKEYDKVLRIEELKSRTHKV